VLKGGFGAWEDVGWCGWVLGGLRWPSRGFFKTRPTGKTTGGRRETTGGKQGNYRRPTRGGKEQFSLF